MNHFTQFFGRLLLIILFLMVIMYFMHEIAALSRYRDLTLYSIIMFTVMSIVLYVILRKSLFNADKQVFISITLANMLMRMLCSIILLLIYKKLKAPADNNFIISFLIVYIIFTIFETYFMVRLSDHKPKKHAT